MKGSLKIAKWFGIPVLLHWSFALVPAVILYYWIKEGGDTGELIWSSLFAFCLFTCILLHEYGHALTARKFGVRTKDIVLLPIGGLARLEKLPERPAQELLVAVAGPLVNVAIAVLLLPYLLLVTWPQLGFAAQPTMENLASDYFYFVPLVFFLNLTLAVFNLLPAFPMDGGRILRALLTMKFPRITATTVAVRIGQAIAVAMVAGGLWFGKPTYVLIGLFIFSSGAQELGWARTENLLAMHQVGQVFRPSFPILFLDDPIEKAEELLQQHGVRALPVVDETGQMRGTFSGLEATNEVDMGMATVQESYRPSAQTVDLSCSLKEAFDTLRADGAEILPVSDNGALVGAIDEAMIWDFLAKSQKKKSPG